MKYIKFIIGITITIITLSLIFTIPACHTRTELDIKYDSLMRVVGPEGGIIKYYEYNPKDSLSVIAVKMEIPEGALDSFIVFNMHEFEDDALYVDLSYLGIEQFSDFLYFVPFYESYGYNEQTNDNTDYHLSIDFNTPAKVTFNLNFYNVPDTAKLYKIKIPRINEWGETDNIWVNWNYQGYPDGYDVLDLQYIINGKWTIEDAWGSGNLSLNNWEEVIDYDFDTTNRTVQFEIENTDYLYVMAAEEL